MWESRPAMPALKYESRAAAALQVPQQQASLFRRKARLKLEVEWNGEEKQGTYWNLGTVRRGRRLGRLTKPSAWVSKRVASRPPRTSLVLLLMLQGQALASCICASRTKS